MNKKVGLIIGGLILLLGTLGSVSGTSKSLISNSSVIQSQSPQNQPTTESVTNTPTPATAPAPVAATKETTSTEGVAFDYQSVNDPTLAQGTTKVTQTGLAGVRTITYKVYLSDGVETKREKISEQITTVPRSQITAIGTKAPALASCSGGYINVDGNCVQSPTYSPTIPAGASAQCKDGTYSFSQHRQGTCSGHGGVATWL